MLAWGLRPPANRTTPSPGSCTRTRSRPCGRASSRPAPRRTRPPNPVLAAILLHCRRDRLAELRRDLRVRDVHVGNQVAGHVPFLPARPRRSGVCRCHPGAVAAPPVAPRSAAPRASQSPPRRVDRRRVDAPERPGPAHPLLRVEHPPGRHGERRDPDGEHVRLQALHHYQYSSRPARESA